MLRIFQWMLMMTGIMCLSLLSGGLILCDLVAVTAHWELLHHVLLPQSQGSPGANSGTSFRRLHGQYFWFLFTVLNLLLFDEMEGFCLKVCFMVRFLLISFYLVFLSCQPNFLCIWISKSVNKYLLSIYRGPLSMGFHWEKYNFYIQ